MKLSRSIFLLCLLHVSCNTTPDFSPTFSNKLRVFPNPTTSNVFVDAVNPGNNGIIKVFDSKGELFFNESVLNGENRYEITLEGRPEGTYHIAVELDNETLTSKFIRVK